MAYFITYEEDVDNSCVTLNGRKAAILHEIKEDLYKVARLPGCTIGEYFAILNFLKDKGLDVV